MTYIPNKSLRKSIGSVRIVHTGAGAADLYIGDGASSAITFTVGDFTEIFASTAQIVKALEVFDSSGEAAKFATGAAASEVTQFRIVPGGNGMNYFQVDGASRISLCYEDVLPANGSETVINFFY